MLNKFQMEDCKLVSTPMITGCKLNKGDESKEVYQFSYRSMIGNLLYVTTSRHDVMQVDRVVVIFQYAPRETHVHAVKRIFRYLKGIMNHELWYPRGKYFSLTTYSDVDWESYVDDRNSTSGCAFFPSDFLVSYLSRK